MSEDDETDEWLPIRAAARRLGVTPTAIRNRIKRGTLQAKPDGNRGQLVRVPITVTVTGDRAEGEPVTVTGSPVETVTVTALLSRIAHLEGRLEELLPLQGEIKVLRERLAEMQRPWWQRWRRSA